jgi:serine/threonine protein kinase
MNWERSMRFIGRSKVAYTLREPLYPRLSSGAKAHVWKAQSSVSNQVVMKFRSLDTPQSRLNFQKEISQGQRFKDARYIRRLLDVIDDSTEKDTDCGIVLEWFPETLWEARENGRLASFGLSGIRKIMKDVLKGIQESHTQGVIHLGSQ